jgi:hypothetical protein
MADAFEEGGDAILSSKGSWPSAMPPLLEDSHYITVVVLHLENNGKCAMADALTLGTTTSKTTR